MDHNGDKLPFVFTVTRIVDSESVEGDIARDTIVEVSVVQFSVLQGYRLTRYVAVSCGLEFVVGDCHGQPSFNSCGVQNST
jgi:hypothetical protein